MRLQTHLPYLVALICIAASSCTAETQAVRTGAELLTALANNSVTNITISCNVALDTAAFEAARVAQPISVARDVTIAGQPGVWPTLDCAFAKDKVRLAAGVVFTFAQLVLDRGALGAPTLVALGFDIFTAMRPGETAVVRVLQAASRHKACVAPVTLQKVVKAWPASSPYGAPPRMRGNISQAGCVPLPADAAVAAQLSRVPLPAGGQAGATAGWEAQPGGAELEQQVARWLQANPMQRCYPVTHMVEYVAFTSQVVTAAGIPQDTGVVVVIEDTLALCRVMMSESCIDSLGFLGCQLATVSGLDSNASVPGPQGPGCPAEPIGLPGMLIHNSSEGAGGSSGVSSSSGGSGVSTGALVAAVVGGVLGALLLAAVVLAAVLSLRRRRAQQDAGGGGCDSSSSLQSAALTSTDDLVLSQHNAKGSTLDMSTAEYLSGRGSSVATGPITPAMPWRSDLHLGVRVQVQGDCSSSPRAPRHEAAEQGVHGQPPPLPLHAPGAGHPSTLAAASGRHTRGDGQEGKEEGEGEQQQQAGVQEVQLLPEVLGRGAYGAVCKGTYCGEVVAVKVVGGLLAGCADEALAVKQFSQEVAVLGRCRHPNVVRLLAACVTPPRLCLVMELMDTSLEWLLHGRAGAPLLPLDTVLHIGLEIARGLDYLHPTIVHRDLKPANVLLSNALSPEPVVKLADFGLSRLRSTLVPTITPEAGTPAYLSPEAYDPNNSVITHKADIYALGVILWECLTGLLPWVGCTRIAVAITLVMHRRRLPVDDVPEERCPPRLRRLIRACWEHDPRRRPAAAEVVKALLLVQEELQMGGQCRSAGGSGAASTGTAVLPSSLPPWARALRTAPPPAEGPAGAEGLGAGAARLEEQLQPELEVFKLEIIDLQAQPQQRHMRLERPCLQQQQQHGGRAAGASLLAGGESGARSDAMSLVSVQVASDLTQYLSPQPRHSCEVGLDAGAAACAAREGAWADVHPAAGAAPQEAQLSAAPSATLAVLPFGGSDAGWGSAYHTPTS